MDLKSRFSLALVVAGAVGLALFAASVYSGVKERLLLSAEDRLAAHMDREWRHLVQHEGVLGAADDLPGTGEAFHRIYRDDALIVDSLPKSLDPESPRVLSREFRGTLHDRRFRVIGYFDLRPTESYLEQLRSTLIRRSLLVLLLLMPLSWLLARALLRPFRDLAAATSGLGAQQLSFRFPEPRRNDEHGRLVRSFNALLERLELSFGHLRRFATNASHELRTPLTVIRGEAEWLLRKSRTPAEYEEGLRTIVTRADGLQQIIRRLLSFADLERARWGSAPAEPLDVRAKIAELVQALEKAHPQSPRRLQVGPGEAKFAGAPELFASVATNLLENAIKYSRTTVAVAFRETGGGLRLEVEDDGPGIPPESREAVFDPMFKGLGLSIVKACINAVRGTIELGESPLGGLRVAVWIPQSYE